MMWGYWVTKYKKFTAADRINYVNQFKSGGLTRGDFCKQNGIALRSLSDWIGVYGKRDIKIVYFTDAHNQPGLSFDRFFWLCNFVKDVSPDYLVDGGDFDDFNSLCRHERNETYQGKFKPAFQKDLEHSAQARKIISDNISPKIIKYALLGNHEQRIWDFENINPEMYGTMTSAYMDTLLGNDWAVTHYKAYLTLHGVDFTHVPMNGMNKPVGGKNPCNLISRDSIRDVCFGHTHSIGLQENHKLGPSRSVVAFNGGCFMPDGYVPSYAQNSQKRFWYGAHVLRIINERLHVEQSLTMREIEKKYSN
jgi:hypothetical protein